LILDTNAVSSLLTGDERLGRILPGVEGHQLPLVVVAEYQFGLLGLDQRSRLPSLFRRLEASSIVLCPDRQTADSYASIRFELKRKGRPIPENDMWIAALARQHSLEIVSRDPHFDAVDGVQRIGW
jgi:predicted nucleic acid-binding protein